MIRQTSSTAENRGQTFHQFYIRGRKNGISHPSENQPLIVSEFFEKDIRKEDTIKKRETDKQFRVNGLELSQSTRKIQKTEFPSHPQIKH